ncbi:MAG: NAD(P)/FAD-dependent oxidoreductase [Woeseiaceae bacterium]
MSAEPVPEHAASWYAASANDVTACPPLAGSVDADVCVIGAGYTGLSSAICLAERGFRVVVLEARKVGFGASGRNGGQMIGGISGEERIARHSGPEYEDLLWELRWAGHDIIRARVAKYDIRCDLKAGYVDVAIKARHLRALERAAETLARRNFPHDFGLMSAAETRAALGTGAYIGALRNMANGHLHPLELCIGEARAAASLGAAIYEHSPVTSLESGGVGHGSKVTAHTPHGSVIADAVIIAGNAYQAFEPRLSRRFFPVRSYIIATAPLSAAQLETVNPRDYAVCDPNFVLEYFRLSTDRRLLFGGRCNYFGKDSRRIATELRPRMERIYPQLAGIAIDYAWGGTIAVTPRRTPQLGRLAPNLWYSQGYSGHGINVSHLAGELLAEAIAGSMERFDVLARMKSAVIPGVTRFGRQMVSLGLLYYGLRDRL